MNPTIRSIYYKRYGKSLIAIILLLFFFYWTGAFGLNNSWQGHYEWLHSYEFETKHYNNDLDNQIKGYVGDSDTPIYYSSIDEYRDEELTVYHASNAPYLPTIRESADQYFLRNEYYDYGSTSDPNDYQRGVEYYFRFGGSDPIFTMGLMLLAGFALFFVDPKTNFNRFLFSLPVSRRQLFTGKLLYLGLPLLGALALAILGSIFINYFGIPAPYLNVTLPQMLYSGLSHFATMTLLLTSGIFFGALLGNLVLGPAALMGGLFFFVGFFNPFYIQFNNLITYFFPNIHLQNPWTLIVTSVGKTGTTLTTLILFFLFSLVLLGLTERIYQKTSMENDGDFVTDPSLRLPTFLSLCIGSNLFFGIGSTPWSWVFSIDPTEYYVNRSGYWFTLLVQFVLVFIVSFGLVYFQSIQKWWRKRRDLRLKQKSI